MGFLLSDAKGGQEFQDQVGLDFQFPSQFVDSNFLHMR
jgi:hypothetical protein